jgi:hypothetical protein|tara:strand:+ start:173 stop:361 length:189 start_codon:yes stop_codon:yes gene_type:complete
MSKNEVHFCAFCRFATNDFDDIVILDNGDPIHLHNNSCLTNWKAGKKREDNDLQRLRNQGVL